ncbi:MAG: MaoC family dehydratase [Micrococcales bacterium]|nr:MaoC family dehydratase [Micrococcales bacterium]NBR55082.1 MaoC family dehydratase [Micrococcales bacterium]NBR61904.1 MaoC family dehydratase [Actinomycetota bacterium]NBT47849.1 MaoC family dehydratase [Actinomycetota bacterium]NBY43923.1 MaoC family dehydratase [Micrococcales bacterium]
MVNPNVQGKKYPETPSYLVGREKIREFANAVFSTNPINHEVAAAKAAGYADLVAPPTFGVVIQERSLHDVLADPEADIDFSRVVHGDQRFVLNRPIVAGDELTSVLTVASVKALGAHSMITFNTEIFDVKKDLVCTAISTLVVRGGE